MPIPPAVIGLLASPKKLGQGLVAAGVIVGGLGAGIERAGSMLSGAEAQAAGAGVAVIEVANACASEIGRLRAESSQLEVELALCAEE